MKKIFSPLEDLNTSNKTSIIGVWLIGLLLFWVGCATIGTTHMFPTPFQVGNGFISLWNDGLVVHIASSVWLCTKAVFISILISLFFSYTSTIPAFKPNGLFISKLRFLPLTGISFYLSLLFNDARNLQIAVLVVFMTTFLTTSLMSMIKDIPIQEFEHAKTLGCNRWETLWEVVIQGRIDYVFELVRQNLAIVWMMLVTVESILVAAGGLGYLIKNQDKLGDNGKVIALQIIIVLVGLLLDYAITKIRKTLFRYSNY